MWNNKHEANNSTQTQAKQHYIPKQQFPHLKHQIIVRKHTQSMQTH